MEQIILNILEALRRGETVDDKALVKLIHAEARREGAEKRDLAKRRLLPFYQRVKREEPARWAGWNVDTELERQLLQVLRMKPRRTASGVATITVITKPWPCSGDCLFCPNDLRMPKSYLHAEPACARAEQNCFDPYLQVSARLTALSQMGHATDKIELIVLGGTWSDYPQGYQTWFMSELFRALNDDAVAGVKACTLRVSVLHYRKVAEHVRIVFITAGCQDHAVLSSDILRSSVYFDNDAVNDSSLRVLNELLARSVVPNINVAFALVDVFLNQSVQSAVTAGRVNHGRSDGVGTRGIGIFGTNFNLRIFSAEELHIVKEAL